jgi:hypothetical protein
MNISASGNKLTLSPLPWQSTDLTFPALFVWLTGVVIRQVGRTLMLCRPRSVFELAHI